MEGALIVLDTHALVFWVQRPDYLSREALQAIERAPEIGISAITFWEVSLLVRKSRLSLGENTPVSLWMKEVLNIPRVRALPVTAPIAVAADALSMHSDPADRLIAATALEHMAPVVTRDEHLRSCAWLQTVW